MEATNALRLDLKVLVVALALGAIWPASGASAAFVISFQPGCSQGQGTEPTYGYGFTRSSLGADWTVGVNMATANLFYDIHMQIVDDPMQADLIVVDNLTQYDMKVCKVRPLSSGYTIISIPDYTLLADINIWLTRRPTFLTSKPSYKIFVASEEMAIREAAALFAVIWASNRK